ncbi:MAG: SDR family NAD(P)-dependent oxidoreductase [Ktedonobacterales bacterium]
MKKATSTRAGRPLAIIIGASTGMGAALARRLVEEGFQVALAARQAEKLAALAGDLNARGEKSVAPVARAYPHDVCDYDTVANLLDRIRRDAGQDGGELRVVVYAAGIMPPGEQGNWTFTEERRTVETNLIGAMAWMSASAEIMKRIGQGTIVGISSVAGERGRKGNSAYMASKAALTTYMESLCYRLRGTGVRVVTVKPGYVATPMTSSLKLPKALTISADAAAIAIARLCKSGKPVAYVPGYWRPVMLIIRALPASILVRLPI